MTDAQKFYGTAYTVERAANLTKATRYLDMACRAEGSGEPHKVEMALNAAL
jgi:hypothetical protein